MTSTQRKLLAAGAAAGLWAAARLAHRWRQSFRDKVVVITGGSRGLGLVLARRFAAEGAWLALLARDADELHRAERDLARFDVPVVSVACDLRSQEEATNAIGDIVECFGRIDVLVNNVGIAVRQAFDALTLETWNDVWLTNMTSMMLCVKACLPHLRASSRPAIVNLSSINALRTIAGMGAYPATKAAIIGFTQSLAIDLAPHIRVNAVAPGVIMTEMWQSQMDDLESAIAYRLPYIPRGRIGEAADIGKAVAFLASDDADFITGSILIVDGGQHAKLYAG